MYFRICPVAVEKTCINLNVVLTYKEIFKKFEENLESAALIEITRLSHNIFYVHLFYIKL